MMVMPVLLFLRAVVCTIDRSPTVFCIEGVKAVKFWFLSTKYKQHCSLSSYQTYAIFLEPAYCRSIFFT
jgi:hypothetical protein